MSEQMNGRVNEAVSLRGINKTENWKLQRKRGTFDHGLLTTEDLAFIQWETLGLLRHELIEMGFKVDCFHSRIANKA